MSLKSIIKNVFLWRVFITLVSIVGILLVPFKDSFPYRNEILKPFGSPVFWSWGNFDGVHYLNIAREGYFAEFSQAFFPVFPLLIRYLNIFFQNHLATGLFLSHVSFVFFIYYLYKLILLDHDKYVAKKAILALILFPTSFYFVSLYTESFFMLLVVGSFYAFRTKRQTLGIILAAIASSTRIVGIFLLPALLYEKYISLPKNQNKNFVHYLPFAFIGLGLFSYMAHLYINYGDALYFLHAQPSFGAGRSDKLILLYQVIYRYIKMLFTVYPLSLVFLTVVQEFVSSIFFLFLLLKGVLKGRFSYYIFSFLAFITPTLTGTFSSMPRYVLVLFPAFILIGQTKNRLLFQAYIIVSVILLIINTILFTRGYWVA